MSNRQRPNGWVRCYDVPRDMLVISSICAAHPSMRPRDVWCIHYASCRLGVGWSYLVFPRTSFARGPNSCMGLDGPPPLYIFIFSCSCDTCFAACQLYLNGLINAFAAFACFIHSMPNVLERNLAYGHLSKEVSGVLFSPEGRITCYAHMCKV